MVMHLSNSMMPKTRLICVQGLLFILLSIMYFDVTVAALNYHASVSFWRPSCPGVYRRRSGSALHPEQDLGMANVQALSGGMYPQGCIASICQSWADQTFSKPTAIFLTNKNPPTSQNTSFFLKRKTLFIPQNPGAPSAHMMPILLPEAACSPHTLGNFQTT